MITKGMKIEAIKDIYDVIKTGEICEITEIKSNDSIAFRFGGCHLGVMTLKECNEYFKPYNTCNKNKKVWSKWKSKTKNYFTLDGEFRSIAIEYRTNGQRVQVRTGVCGSYLKARSSCSPRDNFVMGNGLDLAEKRLIMKLHQQELDKVVNAS